MSRATQGPGLTARLLAAQALVVLAGSVTLLLVALGVAPGLFRTHVRRALGPVSESTARHLDEAFGRAVLIALAIAVLAALLTALAVSVVISKRLTRPVQELARAATDLAAGAYGARVPAYRLGPEVDALSGAFNEMAATLESTERRRREMLSDLAHELRTPLATLESYVEGLDDGIIAADDETWATLHDQTTRLRRLVDDVTEVSRAEERSLDLRPVQLDLRTVVDDAVADASPSYAAKGVALRVEAGPSAAPVHGDPVRLREVVDNLLTNALRHTPAGGDVVVSVRGRAGTAELAVADDGDGIAPEHLPRVFERFYRADPARSRGTGGSGIGLAIVRALVSAHGGRIRAESAGLGRGTRFVVTLPADRTSA